MHASLQCLAFLIVSETRTVIRHIWFLQLLCVRRLFIRGEPFDICWNVLQTHDETYLLVVEYDWLSEEILLFISGKQTLGNKYY